MQYQVPQFIEIEDKIFGPLTFRQFVYLAGAAGACLLFFTFLPWWLAAVCALPFGALGVALAFYKVNGRPFIDALEHAIRYFLGDKLYLWQQRSEERTQTPDIAVQKAAEELVPRISESKLKDLAWSLNIKDREEGGGEGATQNQGFRI